MSHCRAALVKFDEMATIGIHHCRREDRSARMAPPASRRQVELRARPTQLIISPSINRRMPGRLFAKTRPWPSQSPNGAANNLWPAFHY